MKRESLTLHTNNLRLVISGTVYLAMVVAVRAYNLHGRAEWLALSLFLLTTLPLVVLPLNEIRRLSAWNTTWTLAALAAGLGLLALSHLLIMAVTRFYLHSIFAVPKVILFLKRVPSVALMALAEELFFRGYLQEGVFKNLWQDRGHKGLTYKNLATSLLFGITHVITYGSWLKITTFFGSLVFGWLVEKAKGSLWPAFALHTTNNLATSWWTALLNANLVLSHLVH